MSMNIICAIISVVLGIIYIVEPGIFQIIRGKLSRGPSVLERILTPEQYILFMRLMGCLLIVLGFGFIYLANHLP